MSYEIIKHQYLDGVKDYYEFSIDLSNDLTSLPACVGGSTAIAASGLKYVASPAGTWALDMSSYGASADVLGELPHVLNVTEGENSSLAVAEGETPLTDGTLVYKGDSLTVTYSADTGYDVVCTINGEEAGESPDTYVVGLCDDVTIVTTATLQTFDLSITVDENTTVTVVDSEENEYEDGDTVAYGTELTITAAGNTGYTVATFTVNTVDKTESNPDTHSVTGDVTIAATSALNTYTLTLTQGANTTLTVLDGETPVTTGASVDHGTVLTVTAEAAVGYDLTTFTIGGEAATSPAELTMTEDVTIVTAATEQ